MGKRLLGSVLRASLVSGSLLSLLFIVAHAVPALQTNPPNNDEALNDHIKRANTAFDSKQFKVARDEAQLALKSKNDSPQANFLLALAYNGLNKPKDSLKYVKEAIKYRADYPDAHYLLALLYYDKNEVAPATEELNRAMTLGVRFSTAYVLKGTLELMAGLNQSALQSYREAVKLASANDPALPQLRQRVTALENYLEFYKHLSEGVSMVNPVLLNSPQPHYTEAARQHRIQGAVKSAVLINEQGRVSSIILLSHLGWGLDEQAIAAAQSLKFTPGTKDGKPTPFWKNVIIEFNLR